DGTGAVTLVASAAMVHYHRAGCRLAAGKPVEPADAAGHRRAGRTPCGVCLAGSGPDPGGQR
ncbi:MAG TPA: hypothetical protein VHL53_21680, partial [Acidimicrobiia bacterium]|nr:hypothetical protein [Acidimicrobiia bacterium]